MTRGEIINEYRRMNSEDRMAFRRWLMVNTVVGALCVFTLIAVTSIFSGGSSVDTAQKDALHAHVK